MDNIESRYSEAIDFLFNSFPVFQNKGAGAYKPGLGRTLALAAAFGDPYRRLDIIHVAGTNGKGSTSHTIAAVLQESGYRTGLFTSPHLVDFRERIRIDGKMISREEVVDFVDRFRALDFAETPSFFELTTVMALDHFARNGVDCVVLEVGLGGRLDSTNIVTPRLSVITNISKDHTMFLGDTPEKIASEKAGIIKPGVPVVIGRASGGVRECFQRKADAEGAPIVFAFERLGDVTAERDGDGWLYRSTPFGDIFGELAGDCQPENARTVMAALEMFRRQGLAISDEAVARGFAGVTGLTGLMGRWMTVGHNPVIICDTGHNEDGWRFIASRLSGIQPMKHIVIGFVSDKDVASILGMISEIDNCRFYLTRPSVERALPEVELAAKCAAVGIEGEVYGSVDEAVEAAVGNCGDGEVVFVGGSTFVVADFLSGRFSPFCER